MTYRIKGAATRWIDLAHGVSIEVRPLTTAMLMPLLNDIKRGAEALDDEQVGHALTGKIGPKVITAWRGVYGPQGTKPLELTEAGIEALLADPPMGLAFMERYVGPVMADIEGKKNSRRSPTGSTAAATNTARPAARSARNARSGSTRPRPKRNT